MSFFTGYIAQGVGGPGTFVENVAAGYARGPVTITALNANQFAVTASASNSGHSGTQLGLYDAATGGNLIAWWNTITPQGFAAAATNASDAGGAALTLLYANNNIPAGQQIGKTFDGQSILAGIPLIVSNGVLAAAPTSGASTGTTATSATPVRQRVTTSATISSATNYVSVNQSAASTYTLAGGWTDGFVTTFKDVGRNLSASNTATITPPNGVTIDGVASYVMNIAGEQFNLVFDATNNNLDIAT